MKADKKPLQGIKKKQESCYFPASFLLWFSYYFFLFLHLSKRRNPVKVFGDIRIKNSTVVFCHIQCAVTQKPLEHKRIAAAVNHDTVFLVVPGDIAVCSQFSDMKTEEAYKCQTGMTAVMGITIIILLFVISLFI